MYVCCPLRSQVPEYLAVIERPVTVLSLLEDLEALSGRGVGEGGDGDVDVVDRFALSVRRMWENCWSYNHEGTKVRLMLVVRNVVGVVGVGVFAVVLRLERLQLMLGDGSLLAVIFGSVYYNSRECSRLSIIVRCICGTWRRRLMHSSVFGTAPLRMMN